MLTHPLLLAENQRSEGECDDASPSHLATRSLQILIIICISLTLILLASLLFLASRHQLTKDGISHAISLLLQNLSPQILLLWGAFIALCVFSIIAVFVGLALYIVNTLLRPKKRDHFLPLTSFALDLPAEEITFLSAGGDHQVRGLYIPQRDTTTTIIVSPGYRRGLTDVLGMCKHLWAAGHNILAFEYYGHGMVVGTPVTLGYREVNDFLGAVSYAKQRAPQDRIGVLGYSMGGAVSIMGSAQVPEVQAVVADSAFASQWSAVEMAVRRTLHLPHKTFLSAMSLLRWTADILLGWRAGYHFHFVEPARDIARLAPRPVLLIHGLNDTVVHPDDSLRLYHAAGEPKELWHLPDTEHVKAYFTDSATYTTKIIRFFDEHLKHPLLAEHDAMESQQPTETLEDFSLEHRSRSLPERKQTALPFQKTVAATPLQRVPLSRLGRAYGRFVYRFRWAIIAFWFIVLLASLPFARNVATVLNNSGYSISGSESNHVNDLLTSTLHQPTTQMLIVLQADHALVTSSAYQHEITLIVAQVRHLPHVIQVTPGTVGRDGKSTFLAVGFNESKDDLATHIPDIRQHLVHIASGPAHLSLTGDAVIASDVELDTQTDTEQAERLALPLTLLVLLLVFGTVVAGLMPLLLAGIAVPTALAVVYGIALHVETNIFSQSLVSIIGLGLSIDYSLFLVRRFREELAQECEVSEAIARTIATAGEAILFSALIVIVGFAGLLLIGIEIMSSFSIGGMAVASIAALSALTFLPAMLSVVGTRINSLRIPFVAQWTRRFSGLGGAKGHGFWQRWSLFVMRRSVPIVLLVIVILAALGWPARTLNPGVSGTDALPQGSESRLALRTFSQQFPNENFDPLVVLVRTSNGSPILAANHLQQLQTLTEWILHRSHVVDVVSLTRPPQKPDSPVLTATQLFRLYSTGGYQRLPALKALVNSTTAGDTTMISVRTTTVSGSSDDQALIDQLRSIPPESKAGFVTLVGGARAINQDFMRVLYGNFLRTLLFILIATFVILLLTFRSVLLPLKAIVMNILSIAASYGALVFVFQQGHFQNVLNFTADGVIDRFIPPLLFCVLFGLSMDYEVFLLTRIQEEWKLTQDNQRAVVYGVEKTAGVISNAALLFTIVSASFILTSLVITKELGFGISVAIITDATIVRLLLVPATMQLMGKWNWWFPGASRIFLTARTKKEASYSAQPVRAKPEPPSGEKRSLAQQAAIEQTLMHMMAELLELPREQIRMTGNFFEYGGDSQSLEALLMGIEQRWHVLLKADDVFNHPVVFRLAAFIAQSQRPPHTLVSRPEVTCIK